MTLSELYSKLKSLGLKDEDFYLHGLYGSTSDDEKLSLIMYKGKYTLIYQIYYRERGEKHSIMEFTKKEDACDYFLKKLSK